MLDESLTKPSSTAALSASPIGPLRQHGVIGSQFRIRIPVGGTIQLVCPSLVMP
jgi:hypothetical protein